MGSVCYLTFNDNLDRYKKNIEVIINLRLMSMDDLKKLKQQFFI